MFLSQPLREIATRILNKARAVHLVDSDCVINSCIVNKSTVNLFTMQMPRCVLGTVKGTLSAIMRLQTLQKLINSYYARDITIEPIGFIYSSFSKYARSGIVCVKNFNGVVAIAELAISHLNFLMSEHDFPLTMPLPYMIFWLRPVATALSFVQQNPKVIHAILTTTVWGDNLAIVTLLRMILVGVFGGVSGYLIGLVTLKVHSLVLAFNEMAEALGIDLHALEAASAFA